MEIKQILIVFFLAAKDLGSWFLDLVFPPRCVSCKKENKHAVCQQCALSFKRLSAQVCPVCRDFSIGGITHPACTSPHSPDGQISVFDYRDKKLASAIITGKYSFVPDVFLEFGKIMAREILNSHKHVAAVLPAILCPIPLSRQRQRWRGFNQSQKLCAGICEIFRAQNITCQTENLLSRKKRTKTQKDLGKQSRTLNMAGAFEINGGINIYGKEIMLVDDVTTTGTTLKEACKVLKRNGAHKVWLMTLARD